MKRKYSRDIDDEDDDDSAMPLYQRRETGCIDPCPHFECILSKDICSTNCDRTLSNPCKLCKNNYEGECSKADDKADMKRILLRREVIAFMNSNAGKNVDFVTKDNIAERRLEYVDRLNKVEDEEADLVERITASSTPNFILKFLYRKKIEAIKVKKAKIEGLLEGQDELIA